VEVTIAIGIVAFALLAVVGLLPAGLRSVQNANEQAGAASVLDSIASALNSATVTDDSNPNTFTATFPFATNSNNSSVSFNLASNPGTSGGTFQWTELTLEGTENPAFKRLSAILIINELPTRSTPGRATISVAWSAASNPTWQSAEKKWSKAEGSLTSAILFLPRLPR
jgi:uncharacterized protein (TIGR02598 family)